MVQIGILAGAILCAVQAVRSKRLLVSALWLAGTSALVAWLIFLFGAPELAAIELSVGAGLVTILFVFAIHIAGEEPQAVASMLPRPAAWGLTGISTILLLIVTLPGIGLRTSIPILSSFTVVLWEQRGLDVLLQVALIFSGILGVLGLLAGSDQPNLGAEKDPS
jgi:NADH:ubiquinone oxidoreductase subunit 6 (subunit J)